MNKKLFSFIALFMILFVSAQGYAQNEQKILTLGSYDAPVAEESWDGFNLQNAPVIFTYAHSGSQVLYTPEQLAGMKDKKITSMTFKCLPDNCYKESYTSNLKMYMQEIDEAKFPYDNVTEQLSWVKFDEKNLVAEMEFTMSPLEAYSNGTDIELKFDLSEKPYVYSGKTLIVTVVNDSQGCIEGSEGAIRFYWIPSKKEDTWKSLVFGNDNISFADNQAKDNIIKASDDETMWKNAPAVKFTYEDAAVPPTPEPEPTPTPEDGVLKLGNYDSPVAEESWDGFNLQNAPVIFSYAHSGSQVLYTPEQLAGMKDKQITSMTFKCFPDNCYKESYTSNLKMYMQEIDEAKFPYDNVAEQFSWVKFDEKNLVAEMEFTMSPLEAYSNGTDIELKFDLSEKPYVYSGKTLIVTVVNDSQGCIEGSEGAIRFYWIQSKKEDPWKSFVFGSDNITFADNQAKDNVIKALDNETMWKNTPMAKFTFEDVKDVPTPPAPTDFSGGEGTAEKPYLISKAEDFVQMDEWCTQKKTKGVFFKLTQDITDAFSGFIGSKYAFEGNFDGNYRCVNVNIRHSDMEYVGLFGFVLGGSVKNLQVSGNISGKNYVGVIGQAAKGCVIENIANYADINGEMFVGGIAGQVITQENDTSCIITQCANYGTIVSTFGCGGIVGDCGQQVGNNINHIANYGHINCSSYAGGLIGNARPYDQVYFGLNAGTTETENAAGCIGNTKSSTIGSLLYDSQIYITEKFNSAQAKATALLTGSAIKSNDAEDGFSDKFWVFTDKMYPRLKMGGIENSKTAVLYATPMILAEGNTLKNVDSKFTVVTDNGVQWSSANGNVEFDGNTATPVKTGEDIITATLDGVSRSFNIMVNINTGIDEMSQTAGSSVNTESGYLIVSLAENAHVQILEVSGRIAADMVLEAGNHDINLCSGIYIVRIDDSVYKVYVTE